MSQSIYVEGMQHSTPIPAASRIGNFVASGLISGLPPHGEKPGPFEDQCRRMFANIRAVIETAGGDVQSILRLTVWMNDRSKRAELNEQWELMYPDPKHRPARLTLNRELDQGKLLECEIIAVLNG